MMMMISLSATLFNSVFYIGLPDNTHAKRHKRRFERVKIAVPENRTVLYPPVSIIRFSNTPLACIDANYISVREFIKTGFLYIAVYRVMGSWKCCFVMATDGALASKVRVLKREILSSEVLKRKMNTSYYNTQSEYVNYSFAL